MAKEIFIELNRLFDDPNNKQFIKYGYIWHDIVNTIKEIVRVEPNLAEEAFIRLKNLFNNSHFKILPYFLEKINIEDVLKQATKKIPLEKAFKLWADLLYSDHKTKNYEMDKRFILKKLKKEIPLELIKEKETNETFNELTRLLKDSEYDENTKHLIILSLKESVKKCLQKKDGDN